MCGKTYRNSAGFSFIQLIVLLFIMGLLGAVVVPNLLRLFPRYEQRAFFSKLSTLVQFGWQYALETQKTHRVFFDLEKQLVRLEQEGKARAPGADPSFEPVVLPYTRTSLTWPEVLSIKQFYVGGAEYIARPGIRTETVWFFIASDGLTQEVIINWQVGEQEARVEPEQVSLVLNPFTARFKHYENFQKP